MFFKSWLGWGDGITTRVYLSVSYVSGIEDKHTDKNVLEQAIKEEGLSVLIRKLETNAKL